MNQALIQMVKTQDAKAVSKYFKQLDRCSDEQKLCERSRLTASSDWMLFEISVTGTTLSDEVVDFCGVQTTRSDGSAVHVVTAGVVQLLITGQPGKDQPKQIVVTFMGPLIDMDSKKKTALLPVLSEGHWWSLVIRRQTKDNYTVESYNSMQGNGYDQHVSSVVAILLRHLQNTFRECTFQVVPPNSCLQQRKTLNLCGVHVIARMYLEMTDQCDATLTLANIDTFRHICLAWLLRKRERSAAGRFIIPPSPVLRPPKRACIPLSWKQCITDKNARPVLMQLRKLAKQSNRNSLWIKLDQTTWNGFSDWTLLRISVTKEHLSAALVDFCGKHIRGAKPDPNSSVYFVPTAVTLILTKLLDCHSTKKITIESIVAEMVARQLKNETITILIPMFHLDPAYSWTLVIRKNNKSCALEHFNSYHGHINDLVLDSNRANMYQTTTKLFRHLKEMFPHLSWTQERKISHCDGDLQIIAQMYLEQSDQSTHMLRKCDVNTLRLVCLTWLLVHRSESINVPFAPLELCAERRQIEVTPKVEDDVHNKATAMAHSGHTSLFGLGVGLLRLILCGPHIGVRDLGQLAVTCALFGRTYPNGRLTSQTLGLVQEAIRIRCCIAKHGLNPEQSPTQNLYSEWKLLLCTTEFTPGMSVVNNNLHCLGKPDNLIGPVIIPHGVTNLDDYVFNVKVNNVARNSNTGKSFITRITIPDSVTRIGEAAFLNCDRLTSINMPHGITSIRNNTFNGCSSLSAITIPDSVTKIGREAFAECSSLASITISDNVTKIGDKAFAGCSSLASIKFVDTSVGGLEIGWGAFHDCPGLATISIPKGVVYHVITT